MSLRTSCCDFPQKEQYRVFLESLVLLMGLSYPEGLHERPPVKPSTLDLSWKPHQ